LAFADAATRNRTAQDAFAAVPRRSPFDNRWGVWAAGYGGTQTTTGNAAIGSNAMSSRIYGTAVGADYRPSADIRAGFALAGAGTNFSVTNAGSGRSDLLQAGLYARQTFGRAYVSGVLAYGWQHVTTDRIVTIAGADDLQARFDASTLSGRIEGGYRMVPSPFGLTPYAAVQFTTLWLPAYAEAAINGAGTFALSYAAKTVTAPRTELGIRTETAITLPSTELRLRSRLAWAHDGNTDRAASATFQALPGASFVVNGATQSHEVLLATLAVELSWDAHWSAAAGIDGEFSGTTTSYAAKGVLRYRW
jgi:uncharacterized protein with beta-barrel porin domain